MHLWRPRSPGRAINGATDSAIRPPRTLNGATGRDIISARSRPLVLLLGGITHENETTRTLFRPGHRALFCTLCCAAKSYSYFRVGNANDIMTTTTPGTVLMGGGTDADAAFQWMCQRSGGGDFLVIRATGTDLTIHTSSSFARGKTLSRHSSFPTAPLPATRSSPAR